jgi:hypothetical protein
VAIGCVAAWMIAELVWLSRTIRLLREGLRKIECAKKLLMGDPTPSDVLMAEGYIDQAQEIKNGLCTLTGWVIARLRRKLT